MRSPRTKRSPASPQSTAIRVLQAGVIVVIALITANIGLIVVRSGFATGTHGAVALGVVLWAFTDPRRLAGRCKNRNADFEFVRELDEA